MLHRIIKYFLDHPSITFLLLAGILLWGVATLPFQGKPGFLPSDPVAVDAIPNIGENQQIIFTAWKGRSPQDIEDQISYPLTSYLLGIPHVKSVRSHSVFGFSNIYLIFEEGADFYASRSRILEKLNALPQGLLPEGVKPSLGPDATALGQVFWYTVEGRDENGNPAGGWDLHEIRALQDFYIKPALNAVAGVSEVASIGGYVQEYQIDIDPNALNHYNIPLAQVVKAIQKSNRDVGAKTMEINQVEYVVRGLGSIKSATDIEKAVVAFRNNTSIRIQDLVKVNLGPANRRGVLDKSGSEVVGGVVVAQYGANPLEVINKVKAKIEEMAPGLPATTLASGVESQLSIIPFYDRSGLIYETLGTLQEALSLEVLISLLVVLLMVFNLRTSAIIASVLPIAILITFIAMRYLHVDANIVALSGIAIAIGTMVDLAIILSENILKRMQLAPPEEKSTHTIFQAVKEVYPAILTAVATTIVSFIPVFLLEAAEGKLFRPLAYTKTFAIVAALFVSLFILPSLANLVFGFRIRSKKLKHYANYTLSAVGFVVILTGYPIQGVFLFLFGMLPLLKKRVLKDTTPPLLQLALHHAPLLLTVATIVILLTYYWLPLGPSKSFFSNLIFVCILCGGILGMFTWLLRNYQSILSKCLQYKSVFLWIPLLMISFGTLVGFGFSSVFSFVPPGLQKIGWNIENTHIWSGMDRTFPGLGTEFMPSLDEGSFLFMPTSMPHSGITYNQNTLSQLDKIIASIPEVETVVGKAGRVASALDPAPLSMFENLINYKPEYLLNSKGIRQRFQTDGKGNFVTRSGDSLSNQEGITKQLTAKDLIPHKNGKYYRNWRSHIKSADDIWEEIVSKAQIPGLTSAPKLYPIETRLVMLQSGMRAPMGIKVFGNRQDSIEAFGNTLEKILKQIPYVKKEAVFAERIIGKPYLHLHLDRDELERYGLTIADVQEVIEVAIGGKNVTTTIEGRNRFAVRIRYPRAFRDTPENLGKILVTNPAGDQIPLSKVVHLEYEKGSQVIKSEDSFLVSYVLFDKEGNTAEGTVVNTLKQHLQKLIASGSLNVPQGIRYTFAGNYENQMRAEKRFSIIIPVVLCIIFIILYLQFQSASTSFMVFSGIATAFAGGFILLWLYGQEGFANISLFDLNMRELFQIQAVNLSVAVWVGFIALFGIATDDGVLMATYLDQSFAKNKPQSIAHIREIVIAGAQRRITPAVMTSATTVLALLPILTATGRGADIMIPMAIPAFGGMLVAVVNYFLVPVLYAFREEKKWKKNKPS